MTVVLSLVFFYLMQKHLLPFQYFKLIFGMNVLGLTSLLLHVESVLKEYRAKITYVHFLPILTFFFTCLLNYFDIYLLKFSTNQTLFYGIPIQKKGYYTDLVFIRGFLLITITLIIVLTSIKFLKNNTVKKKKKEYIYWIYVYSSINMTSFCIALVYYFSFFDPKFNSLIYNLSSFLIALTVISLTLNPNVLLLITSITKTTVFKLDDNTDVFNKINILMLHEELFLIKNLETNLICDKTGLDKKTVLSAILSNTQGNWKTYINGLRIEYAIQLLKTDYLKNHSIISLGEKSGFNSHQSFFRAFKLKTNMTPGEFYKNNGE